MFIVTGNIMSSKGRRNMQYMCFLSVFFSDLDGVGIGRSRREAFSSRGFQIDSMQRTMQIMAARRCDWTASILCVHH